MADAAGREEAIVRLRGHPGVVAEDLPLPHPVEAESMEQALVIYQEAESTEVADPQDVNNAHTTLGRIALAGGDRVGASEYLAVALQRQQAIGFSWGLGEALRSLGDLARDSGDLIAAAAHYRESVRTAQQHGDKRLLADALAGVAGVAAAEAQPEQAARLYGAVAALRNQLGTAVESWERAPHERGEAAARRPPPGGVRRPPRAR
jgi:hypothetical protein